jgi:NADPH:quinone reductase-like Zn-dependent oxidoreductase
VLENNIESSGATILIGGIGMKAIGYKTAGGAEVLTDIEIPQPVPEARDLLVKVQAISVNPVDTKRRRWETPATAPDYMLLGYDAAGVVEAVGSEVDLFKVGDEVGAISFLR